MKSLRSKTLLAGFLTLLLLFATLWQFNTHYSEANIYAKHLEEHNILVHMFERKAWQDYIESEAECKAGNNRYCDALSGLRSAALVHFEDNKNIKHYDYILYTKAGTILTQSKQIDAPLYNEVPAQPIFAYGKNVFTQHRLNAQDLRLQGSLLLLGSKAKPSNRISTLIWLFLLPTVLLLSLFGWLYMSAINAEGEVAKEHVKSQSLMSAKKLAEDESRQKSQFLANVSHELRTPLNAIIGFSEIIKDEVMGPVQNEQYKEYMHDIHNSGVHLLSLINDILDYSKAEAGKLDVKIEEVDVTKIIRNVMRLVEPKAQEQQVNITSDLGNTHFILHTDSKRLKQVLLNLLSNAVKFTPEGGNITLSGWEDSKHDQLVLEVKDTGVGIAEQDISKVMSTFGQVENKLSRRHEGTGLGLPLSKRLVELMGGTFSIKSRLNEGTTVSFALPLKHEDAEQNKPSEA